MLLPTACRDEEFYFIGEEDSPYLIIILNGREGEGSGDLGIQLSLALATSSEGSAPRHIYQKHDGELSFLLEDLDKGGCVASGDIPVDVSYIVPYLIASYLAEGHPTTSEGRVVLPSEDLLGESPSLDLDTPYLLQEVRGLQS